MSDLARWTAALTLAVLWLAGTSVAAGNKPVLTTPEGLAALEQSLDGTPAPRGVWLTEKKKAAVWIAPCKESGDRLCGQLVWMEKLYDDKGRLRLDWFNPDESKKREPMCGVRVLKSLEQNDTGVWKGEVYNPKDGKTYSGIVRVKGQDQLHLRAYLGFEFLGKSETWTRLEYVPQDPLPCI
ncbi:MAG: DUF2147 domain-containing protein [Rhodovibrionaceae bacterium]|nr:DUF2147 domain-containing protein [Rhodovibrionaceae bacterium]